MENSSVESQKDVNAVDDVPLRTRRGLSMYKVYGDGALLVLKKTSLKSINTLWLSADELSQWGVVLEPTKI